MKIQDVDLLEMMPLFMRTDETVIALCDAFSPKLQDLAAQARNPLIFPRVGEIPEEILDRLAWELSIDWYISDANIEAKRAIIKSAYEIHAHMGTPWAIERVAVEYFGDASVEEWWEYGAEPYHFRVRTGNVEEGTRQAALFTRLVQQIKNVRSVFDGILFETAQPALDIYMGGLLQVVYQMNMDMEV